MRIETCLARAMVKDPSPGVSFVTVEPAPMYDPLFTFTGATRRVPEPMKESLSITGLYLCSPSKFQVIVPAPIFISDPSLASPI